MNTKLALGIVLPSLIVFFLVFLSISNIGFLVDKTTAESIKYYVESANDNYLVLNSSSIQTITIVNDFFIPKRYELTQMVVCLVDKEGVSEARELNVQYTEGRYERNLQAPIFDEIFFDYNYNSRQSVEVPANSKKQIKLSIKPYRINWNNAEDYKNYDEVVLVEKDKSDYYASCWNLNNFDLENSIHIPVVKG